jgi:GNAT superfamily N-acetyltransferase
VTSCFVVITADAAIAAYYTLASGSIPITELPPDITKRMPRYPTLPAVRIGRLGVDERFRGQGFGRLLLWDATARALRAGQANFTLLCLRFNAWLFQGFEDANVVLLAAPVLDRDSADLVEAWQSDEALMTWARLDPLLGDQDLRPYHFVTRLVGLILPGRPLAPALTNGSTG